uniref:C2H2-type domain-containing protein n=1 Tax=viral metagenome TaxID=1070528 RepID=A0A6C0BTT3_9ZZZZ
MSTKKHIFYNCENCQYFTTNKTHWNRHIQTEKHGKVLLATDCQQKKHISHITDTERKIKCECGKIYTDRSGLWRHRKRCDTANDCTGETTVATQEHTTLAGLLQEMMKQNQELQKQLIELANEKKNVINNTINYNKFNLMVFLNEYCKEAVNFSDFVRSLELQLTDLEDTGRLGYVAGISNIFIRNLKNLDIFKRPIHCSDFKRETIYIKEQDNWQKEEGNEKIKNAIESVTNKNIKQLPEWMKQNPEFMNGESKTSDQYLVIMNRSMGVTDDEEYDKKQINKIITNIAKEVTIDKELVMQNV